MAATATVEPKGIQPMRSVLEGLLPPDLGASNADQIAKQNLERVKSRSTPPSAPTIPDALKMPESVVETKIPVPAAPVVEAKPTPITSELAKEPVVESKLSDGLPDLGLADEKLLAALEPKSEIKSDAKKVTTDKLVTGEVEPVSTEIEPDIDAHIEIPKSAKAMQDAIIKTSKLLREKEKKIKELESRGSIDVAATATEPLRQRITELETTLAQANNQLASTHVEYLPWVQNQYVLPIKSAEAFINNVAKNNDGVSAREIFQATNEPDEVKRHTAIRASCSELHSSDALRVEQAVDAIYELGKGLNNIRDNSSQIAANDARQVQEKNAAHQVQFRAEAIKAHEANFKDFIEDPILSQFAEADPEVKKKLHAVLDASKAAELDTSWVANHAIRSKAIQQAIALPLVTKLYQNKMKENLMEIKKLRGELINLRKGSISTQPRTTYQPNAAPTGEKAGDVASIVKGAFAGKL